jgi:hypothetical protein
MISNWLIGGIVLILVVAIGLGKLIKWRKS